MGLVLTTSQNTNEWHSARVGRVTASRIADAMRRLKRSSGNKKAGDWHSDHDEYVRELAREMLTGIPAWHKVTAEMEYGTEKQGEALEAYGKHIGETVETTGFVLHPRLSFLGSSPDGLLSGWGVECKVPLLKTHMDTLIDGEIPEEYLPQMYCGMLCTGLPAWDFVSFCPKDVDDDERLMLPDELRLFVKRLYADEAKFREIEEAATQTIEEAVALVQKLSQSRHLQAEVEQ